MTGSHSGSKRWEHLISSLRNGSGMLRMLLLLIALALFLATAIPFIDNIRAKGVSVTSVGSDPVSIEPASPATCIATVSTPQFAAPDRCGNSDGSFDTASAWRPADWGICADLTVDRIDPVEGVLFGRVALFFPQAFLALHLTDTSGNRLLTYDNAVGDYVLRDQSSASEPFLIMRMIGMDGRASVASPIVLKDVLPAESTSPAGIQKELEKSPCSEEYRADVPIQLPLAANPQAYPSDWYASNATIELLVPPTKILGVKRYDFGTLAPYTLYVGASPGLGNKTVQVLNGFEEITYDADTIRLLKIQLLLKRDIQTKLSVYSVSIVPLLLFLVSLAFLGRRDSSTSWDNFIGIGMGFLAVFSLRQVLVPDDVPGLTRIDFWLGVQSAFLVAILLALRALSWSEQADDCSSAGEHHQSKPD